MNAEVVKLAPRRRSIEVQAGELSRLVAQGQDALIAASGGIYQRGGQLVRIARLEQDTVQNGVKRSAGSTVIIPVTRDYMALALGRAADWERWDKREKAMRRIDPPGAVSSAMIASAGEWKFASLAGIVTAPTLRGDASLLDSPGYDSESHLYAAFNPDDFPAINRAPSREDAEQALDILDDLFSECIFAGGAQSAHASVALAASITACVRQALPLAPAFAMSAFKQGSGKTVTAKVAAQLAMGRDPPVIAPTDDENELKKALLAILIAGDQVVLIDNVAHPVDSAALCAVLTSAIYSDRILGLSQKVTVPTTATWLLTGNAIEFVGDLTSRVLLAVLDPEVENPEARPFKRNLAEYVIAHRGELVKAALTIPLAYVAAGSPKVNAPRSRFAEWDQLVRYPLLWLGAADPLETQAELRGTDPMREALVAVHTAWIDTFGDSPATVADAIEAANGVGQSAKPHLLEALLLAVPDRTGQINNRRLGRYLAKNLRRIENGVRLENGGTNTLTCRPMYQVKRVSSVTSVSSVFSIPTQASCK